MDIGFFDITLTKIVFGIFLVLIYTKLGMLLTNQHIYIKDATNFYSISDSHISRMADHLGSITDDLGSIRHKILDDRFEDKVTAELRIIRIEMETVGKRISEGADVDLYKIEDKLDEVASSLQSIDSKTQKGPEGRDPSLPDWVG